MNVRTIGEYNLLRRNNPRLPAATAKALAVRSTTLPEWADNFDEDAEGVWTGVVNGFDVTISTEVDQDADWSFLGEWTDEEDADTVPNPDPQGGSYKYFRAANVDTLDELRNSGMTAQEARAARRRQAEESARYALEPQYNVDVVFSRDGAEYGRSSLGGCFIDSGNDLLWTVDDHGMIGEAIAATLADQMTERA